MNFRQKIAVSLLLYTALCAAAYAQVVHIPDPKLRSAIRESLNLPPGLHLTPAAIRSLTSLDAGDRGIVDLTGLEHATELTLLAVPRNQISDLAPIAALTKLEYLGIADNPISDITALSNFANLRRFDASGCRFSDISPLANLTHLTRIDLRYNAITDIQPLADLVRLEHMQLSGNRITDVSPLAGLSRLETLEIERNLIADHSPVNALSLDRFIYDEACDMPPLPLEPRLGNRTFPSVLSAWGGVLNQPQLSGIEQLAQHDLHFSGPLFDQRFFDIGDGWVLRGVVERPEQMRDDYIALNPNMVFLVEIRMRDAPPEHFPEDSPYWLRGANGEPVVSGQGLYLIDFTHPDVQEIIVQQAVAVSKCGLYDGVFFDWWDDGWTVLGNYLAFEAEQRARDNILRRIRAETRPNFLIMGNTNRRIIPRTGKHINGSFMETLIPSDFTGDRLEALLSEVEDSLFWLDTNLREPRTNALEGWGVPAEPPDSPTNLRWMRAFTTLSLTHSDGYILFNDGHSHKHFWYDFWDADLGRPIGAKAQLYDEDIPRLYIREFTNGWAVYNHSGAQQVVTLPEEVQAVAGGWAGTEHVLPNLDGEMYLKAVVSDQSPVTSRQ